MNAVVSPSTPPEPGPGPDDARLQRLVLVNAADELRLRDLMDIETASYTHPWTRGNFADSVHNGYLVELLMAGERILGYFVAMKGVGEVHLLNITVAPDQRGQGWSRVMLDALALWSRGEGAQQLWLEVRQSNDRARAIYERYGFQVVGERKRYYPVSWTKREDAIVMSLDLQTPALPAA
ncbi:[SSU ribosomal protein S18P]-alanine acetyltransferase [Comamonas sp. BIGb0124]|mgnify:FL=1|uniref:ribosomal protein S18-alanine N-acetyltransferase n=1 Tax=Comamonas sp. BIGb0124 TaxID=2485130 RepID=UPI000F49BA53|nr:ribosomal protein S18-alanine N-acetyltransferase [Comamonas sp. BIGb0124]ROR20266.1 [SSU ribosomal protein S18P]-alanine acetyltransferase [Comamonas sp. BIGb0124]